MDNTPYEIERKFLIQMPDLSWLAQTAEASRIVQTYLANDDPNVTERVRSRESCGLTVYTHTVKTRLSAIRRIERENEIDRETYETLIRRADPALRQIRKTRYCLRRNDLVYEIDIFPFWNDRAYLEVELSDETQSIPWPEELVCIREVTDDRRYSNASLARNIPMETI